MVCVWGGLAGHAGTVGNKEPSDSSVLKCTLGNAKRKAKRVAYLTAGALPVVCVCARARLCAHPGVCSSYA